MSNAAITPEQILPDGLDKTILTNPYTGESGYARKGIIAATISNVVSLNELLKNETNLETNYADITKITKEIQLLICCLNFTGLFNLMPPTEWIKDHSQPGKVITGILYFKTFPTKMNNAVILEIDQLLQDKKYSFLKK